MPRLSNNLVLLREYQREDIPHINKMSQFQAISSFLSDVFYKPHMLENSEQFYETVIKNKNDLMFVIADVKTEKYIGQIDLRINWQRQSGILGVVLGHPDLLNKGYGSNAINLLLAYAFGELNLHRVELDVLANNEAAIHCYKKCRFVEEGRKRDYLFSQNKYQDLLIFSILAYEFNAY